MIRLRELREKKHLNQQKLALELNITQAAISKYELEISEPDITMLKKISKYFNVSVDYLIGISDVPVINSSDEASVDEQILMGNYRRLDELNKEKVKAYISGLLQE